MTIEINRAGSLYIFRVNQYNERVIEFRRTKAYAHWKPLVTYATAEAARAALFVLERHVASGNCTKQAQEVSSQ